MQRFCGQLAAMRGLAALFLAGCAEPTESTVTTVGQALADATISATAGTTKYEPGSDPLPIDPTLTVDASDPIDGATVAITSGLRTAEDSLVFRTTLGITGTYNAAQGILRLTGSASADVWEAALRAVSYQNTAGTSATVGVRTVTFALGTGLYSSASGHFYESISAADIGWDAARVAAGARTHLGLRGYLATLTSDAEERLVRDALAGQGWIGAMATQAPGSPGNDSGDFDALPRTWYWVTGPEAGAAFFTQDREGASNGGGESIGGSYTAWATNEPNNEGDVEAWARLAPDGTWSDRAHSDTTVDGYVVEYGGMAGDPVVVLRAYRSLEVVRQDQCIIVGTTYSHGQVNPTNSCMACDAAASRTGWTMLVDGYPCATDSLTCTTDTCDGSGTCEHTLYSGCLITDTCIASAASDPANGCQECNPAASTTAYVAKAAGVACTDDGNSNTLDVCNAVGVCTHPLKGSCSIDGVDFAGGAANPENACQFCDPVTSAEDWTSRVSGFPCVTDELSCTSDTCDGAGACDHVLYAGCLIEEACVAAGAVDPLNVCQECNPVLSTTAYVPKAEGVACTEDGNSNTLDVCDLAGACLHPLKGACSINEVDYAGGSANPENVCEFCDPATSTENWTSRVNGFPCATDSLSCTSDTCDGAGACTYALYTGCLIDNVCVSANTVDPSSECQQCTPALSTTAYVAKAVGVACTDDGNANTLDVCNETSECIHPLKGACVIDGADYPGGTANPENVCEFCDPATTEGAFTNRVAGFPCGTDSLSCTSDVCDGSGVCGHTLYTGCLLGDACVQASTTDPANECRECNPTASSSEYVAKPAGLGCTDDGSDNTLDVCNAASECTHPLKGPCSIDGTEHVGGAANPSNPCEFCDPATSTSAWTVRVQAYPCSSDDLSCTADVCDGAGLCEHPLVTGCLIDEQCIATGDADPSNDCRECEPGTSPNAYVDKVAGTTCADDGDSGTQDVCDADGLCTHPATGFCLIDGVEYAGGAGNPDNVCEFCDAVTLDGGWTRRIEGFPCATDGLSCTSDVCDGAGACEHPLITGCLIDGDCTAAGSTDPENECSECSPADSASSYVARAAGVPCADDGDPNTLDVCDSQSECTHRLTGSCSIDGTEYPGGSANPDNVCESCDPGASVASWTLRVAGFPCTSDKRSCTLDVCDSEGACQHELHTGCLIAGECIADGAEAPDDDSAECDPKDSTTEYSPKDSPPATGVPCEKDEDCEAGYCSDGLCAPVLPEDSECTDSAQCASGSCRGGTCRPVAFVGGCQTTRSESSTRSLLLPWLAGALLVLLRSRRRAWPVTDRS